MRKVLKYIACAGMLTLGLGLASCSDDEGITPSDVSNIRSEAGPGQITLRWDTPDDGTIKYIRVTYTDPRQSTPTVRLASVYADSILIPETRHKYGTYSFNVQSISPSGDGGTVQTVTGVSDIAPSTTTYTDAVKLTLTAADLSTNAQDEAEGPIANLVDGILGNSAANQSNFFHTDWHGRVTDPHWIQVKLPQTFTEDDAFKFFYAPRYNGNNKPTDFNLMGSTDGNNWFLIKNFTKDGDGLPITATDTYTSPNLEVEQPFSYIKIVVNETNNGSVFWTMSEFKFYYVVKTVIDPESPDTNI